jgi:hypothetical protein
MHTGTKHIEWNGAEQHEAIDILLGKGHMIVSPTKVGYIIMTSDVGGLKRKFSAKQRARNKPAVVLCGSMEQLRALAQINDEIDEFYQKAWDDDVLIGCILPWKTNAMSHIPDDGSREMMMVDIVSSPGDGTPLDVHEREDEYMFVVEGADSRRRRDHLRAVAERFQLKTARPGTSLITTTSNFVDAG